jgi:hypothetical protein
MTWTSLIGPAVVAAVIASIVSVIGFLISARTARRIHTEKLAFDREQAERRFVREVGVSEARIRADLALAEKRLRLDRTFAAWKRQTEFAEEVLADFYQARDIIAGARSPGSYSHEGETRPKATWESEYDTRKLNAYFSTAERLDNKADFFAQLHARRYRFLALFGKDGSQPFDDIFRIRHEIIVAVQMLVFTYQARTEGSLPEDRGTWERVIWDTQSKDDPIPDRLNRAVEAIETICRPALQAFAE